MSSTKQNVIEIEATFWHASYHNRVRTLKLRNLVLKGLEEISLGQLAADNVLHRLLRNNRDLTSTERATVARRVLGIVCLRARLDYLSRFCHVCASRINSLRLAAYIFFEEKCELEQAANESGLKQAEIRAFLDYVEWPGNPIEKLAAKQSLPRWLAERWIAQFGENEAHQLGAHVNIPGCVTLRVNTLKASREEAKKLLASEGIMTRETLYSPIGLTLEGRYNLFGSRAWREGIFEVQDEGSQLIAMVVNGKPGEKCVDFCAGAGGKTLAIGAQMNNQGTILAYDPNSQRIADMQPRLRRAGVSIVKSSVLDPGANIPLEAMEADRVLVDAPCSSLGVLRRSPDLRWRLDLKQIERSAKIELQILKRASRCVRAGGLLIYATCSIDDLENEMVAQKFSVEQNQFIPVPVSELLGEKLSEQLGAFKYISLYGHRLGTVDGFFAGVWRRSHELSIDHSKKDTVPRPLENLVSFVGRRWDD